MTHSNPTSSPPELALVSSKSNASRREPVPLRDAARRELPPAGRYRMRNTRAPSENILCERRTPATKHIPTRVSQSRDKRHMFLRNVLDCEYIAVEWLTRQRQWQIALIAVPVRPEHVRTSIHRAQHKLMGWVA